MRIFSFSLLLLGACTPTPSDTDKGADGSGNDAVDADGDGLTKDVDCDDEDAAVGLAAAWYADGDTDGYGTGAATTACVQPPGSVSTDTDCDDADGGVHPDAAEACNGADDDCDGDADEGLTATVFYADDDGDGSGDITKPAAACAAAAGYAATGDDCNDADAAYHPGAAEGDCADPNDYNCDGSVGYADGDSDGYAACNDCNDGDDEINPVAIELCNGVDDDCEGTIDIDAANEKVWYYDGDADGHGTDATTMNACDAPADYVATGADCNDADAAYHPGADESDCTDPNDYNCDLSVGYVDGDGDTFAACADCDDADGAVNPDAVEYCDSIDNDCDLTIDEDDAADASMWYADTDSDSFGDATSVTAACDEPAGYSDDATDCEDADGTVNPDATELCDGIDNDCDEEVDEDGAADVAMWYADLDEDGFGDAESMTMACAAPTGSIADGTDCQDNDRAIHPDAVEVCDGVDNDCDLTADEDDAADASMWYADLDEDGFGDGSNMAMACDAPTGYIGDDSDCDDADGAVNPDAIEVCDAIDNDCDASTDEADADDAQTWYADADLDTFGDVSVHTVACDAPAGFVSDDQDCDDDDVTINPDGAEVCNAADDDCDGETDEDSAIDASPWYADTDGDGYGNADDAVVACDAPAGYIDDDTDCDDGVNGDHPGATETCDGADNNCDSAVDEAGAVGESTFYADGDADTYGNASSTVSACDPPSGYVEDDTDCDDTEGDVYPGATEACDTEDDDCDGLVDEGVLGTSASCPAEDCAEILAADPASASGTYSLDAGSYYCNMTTDDGGWTRVANDASVYGTGYSGTYYNGEAFTWSEALFQYDSGSTHGHCTYPSAMTGCNPIGFQFNADSWGVAENWGSSVCGMALSYYTSSTSYIGGYDFVIAHASTTATIRVGMLEGISSCTTGDNSGTAYIDIYVR